MMSEITKGLVVTLEARRGCEDELERFLVAARELAAEEPGTVAWFAFRTGPGSFGIFDVFPDDGARRAHLSGPIAAALLARADELLAEPPVIAEADVLADSIAEAR